MGFEVYETMGRVHAEIEEGPQLDNIRKRLRQQLYTVHGMMRKTKLMRGVTALLWKDELVTEVVEILADVSEQIVKKNGRHGSYR